MTCHMTNLYSVDEREGLLIALDDGVEQREQRLDDVIFLEQYILASTAIPALKV